ncbi:MAG TPA: hypothetical protein VM890_09980 [Longimicrobium sp.]|jgi:hypothetical protein|nr:hypothetical protein [Longimicrobium sp.]
MNRLDVQTSRLQPVMAIVAGIIMVPLGLGNLVSGVMRSFAAVPVAIGLMTLVMFGAVVALARRGRMKSVRYFSEDGLERGDRRFLWWSDLERVVQQIRVSPANGEKALWRTEIWFRNGESAWLLPLRVRNFPEVFQLVSTLPCEHTEKNV